jgi:ABC-type dipeptide/oligopeptide/nickel transport system permease subunit
MADKEKYEKLGPENFDFVQRDEKIYDKRFETKPIGYFKDAMIRFRRNRTNVVATSILLFLILMSILIPMLTSKNYEDLEIQLQNLPPRVPVLENLGILDGTQHLEGQTADLNNYNEELGLYYPLGYDVNLIIEDSLKNNEIFCTDKADTCVGGQTVVNLNKDHDQLTFSKNTTLVFDESQNPQLTVDIYDIISDDPNVVVNVNILYNFGSQSATIGQITEAGVYTFDVFEELDETGVVYGQISFEVLAQTQSNTSVSFTNVTLTDDSEDSPLVDDGGFPLSSYVLGVANTGSILRSQGVMTQVSFKYDIYEERFGEKEVKVFSAQDFDQIMIDYADVCTLPDDMDNIIGWEFEAGCPVVRIIDQGEATEGPDGQDYFSYHLVLDYAIYRGYDEIPYFYFGTTAGGKDFFALVWLGLRTSLFIGLIVAMINISVGIVYGAIEGYYGGTVDLLMERFGEVVGRIPFLVWLGLFVIWLGPGVLTLIVLLTVTGWLGVASTTRTQFYRYKGREYVLASRTMGAKDSRLIFRHILPNGIGTIITASVLMIPGVIFAESTISYLGFGIGHGQNFKIFGLFELSGVSIGVLLADGRTALVERPYLTAFPALIISILMITFNMFGNALRDAFNPSLRGSE